MTPVLVALPAHLRTLAGVGKQITVEVDGEVTIRAVLDAVEAAHPQLRGTIREHATGDRRAFMRYFADGEDVSRQPDSTPLPASVASGVEPLRIVGAIAGG